MDYDLKRPCPHCPFRCDRDGFLRRSSEIADGLRGGATFACHKTTAEDEHDDSRMVEVESSKMCAGAMLVMERDPSGPNQMMRIAERLGMYDPEGLDKQAPVFDSLTQFVAHHEHERPAREPGQAPEPVTEPSGEPCSKAHEGCLAPAAWNGPGGIVVNDSGSFDTCDCIYCGEATCDNCGCTVEDEETGEPVRACNDCVEDGNGVEYETI